AAQRLDAVAERPDQIERLLLLLGHLLELEEGGERLQPHAQRMEDRYGLQHRLLQLVYEPQLDINGGEVERDERRLIGELPLQIAFAGAEQGGLGGAEMAEVTQELSLLPGCPEQDQGILELLVELPGLGIELQRLVRPLEVDVTADQIVAGREQEVWVLLVVDEGDRLVQDSDRALSLARVERGGGPLHHRGGEEMAFAELPIDLLRPFAHLDRLPETPLEDGQRRAPREQ